MSISKLYIAIGLILAFGLFFGIVAYAQDTNEAMKITFNVPVQIPGQVLPAGTYQFKPTDSNEGVVRIFSADGTRLYAMLQTISAQRLVTDEDLVVTVAAAKSSQPSFLVKWFYPGSLVGYELVYPKAQEQQIAQARSRTSAASQVLDGTPVLGN